MKHGNKLILSERQVSSKIANYLNKYSDYCDIEIISLEQGHEIIDYPYYHGKRIARINYISHYGLLNLLQLALEDNGYIVIYIKDKVDKASNHFYEVFYDVVLTKGNLRKRRRMR